MTKSNSFSQALTKSPVLWGMLAAGGFYGLIHGGIVTDLFVQRYFASHPVEYVTAIMFFIGLAALAIKVVDLVGQYQGLSEPLLGPIQSGGQPVSDCHALAARLDKIPQQRQNDYLIRRMREALEHVRRHGSADSLDDQLRYLADVDAARSHGSYALVRIIIWAIPILGFLGTVIGITLAIANLAPEALETSLPEVTAGLGVAFDTTALALGLSMVLMFAQFVTDRAETALLTRVDERTDAELVGRFEQMPAGADGQVVAVRRMAETMVHAVDELVNRQAELWQASIEAAQQRWSRTAETASGQLQSALAGALAKNLKLHAQTMAAAEQSAAEQNRRHWEQVQRSLTQSVEATAALQKGIAGQADVLGRAIAAAADVTRLEESLNSTLGALAGSKNFEQTVMSLAAAIHLLNSRLRDTPVDAPSVQLEATRQAGHAA